MSDLPILSVDSIFSRISHDESADVEVVVTGGEVVEVAISIELLAGEFVDVIAYPNLRADCTEDVVLVADKLPYFH